MARRLIARCFVQMFFKQAGPGAKLISYSHLLTDDNNVNGPLLVLQTARALKGAQVAKTVKCGNRRDVKCVKI